MAAMIGCMAVAAGCGSEAKGAGQAAKPAAKAQQQAAPVMPGTKLTGKSKTLVVYYSLADNMELPKKVEAVTSASLLVNDGKFIGNSGLLAQWIAEAAKADIYAVKNMEKYPSDYNKVVDMGQKELKDNVRPKITGEKLDVSKYDKVYVVYPSWWGDMPMGMFTFFDAYDFSGKTLIPVVTHGGYGPGDSLNSLKKLEPKATIKEYLDVPAEGLAGAKAKVQGRVKSEQ